MEAIQQVNINNLRNDILGILKGVLDTAKQDLQEFTPDLEEISNRSATYAMKVALGDKSASENLAELRTRAGLLAATIAKRGENRLSETIGTIIDVLARFAGILLRSLV